MNTETARAPRAPRKKPTPVEDAPPAAQAQPASVKAEHVMALLWHYRHQAGNTLACVITDKERAEMRASFDYTKQKPAIAVLERAGRLIVTVAEAGTVILDDKGNVVSAGNEIRPCESTEDGGERAMRAAARAQMGQQAQELAGRILHEERTGNFSQETMREAARLLGQYAEQSQ